MTYFNVTRRAFGMKPFQLTDGFPITWPYLVFFNLVWLVFMSTLNGGNKTSAIATTAVTEVLAVIGLLIEWRHGRK